MANYLCLLSGLRHSTTPQPCCESTRQAIPHEHRDHPVRTALSGSSTTAGALADASEVDDAVQEKFVRAKPMVRARPTDFKCIVFPPKAPKSSSGKSSGMFIWWSGNKCSNNFSRGDTIRPTPRPSTWIRAFGVTVGHTPSVLGCTRLMLCEKSPTISRPACCLTRLYALRMRSVGKSAEKLPTDRKCLAARKASCSLGHLTLMLGCFLTP